jgi:hypothetical protein
MPAPALPELADIESIEIAAHPNMVARRGS